MDTEPELAHDTERPSTAIEFLPNDAEDTENFVAEGKEAAAPQEAAKTEEEEARAARKERLKNSRNIRFTIGETDHANEIIPERKITLVDSLQDVPSTTAISTPTRMERATTSLANLDEYFMPASTEDSEAERLLNPEESDDEVERISIKGGDSVKAKSNFLDSFEIPSLDDISDEDEILERLKSQLSMLVGSQSRLTDIMDPGKFVDPLTGETISSQKSKSSESSVTFGMDTESSSGSLDLSDFESVLSFKPDVKEEEELIFYQYEPGSIARETYYDALNPEVIVYSSNKIALDFLNDLIKNVVNQSEALRLEYLLKKNIDKKRLYAKLNDQVNQYNVEKYANEYLNSKVAEYFKRMRNNRAFIKLSPEKHVKEYDRFKEALTQLDFNLKLAAEAKYLNAMQISSALMDLSYLQNISSSSEAYLADKIMSTLGNKSEYIRRITEREIRLMSQKRNEISDMRLSLITRKHTLGRIREEIHKLQQINEDISMDDFIDIQNQTIALNKKIEERNTELKKVRLNYQSDLHVAQHCREKTHAVLNKLRTGHAKLKACQNVQTVLQETLYKAKLEHGSIRKQHAELAYQGGILAMESLMYDYDETVEKVESKRAIVNELKETINHLNRKINNYTPRGSEKSFGYL